jgi:hypothetical protein
MRAQYFDDESISDTDTAPRRIKSKRRTPKKGKREYVPINSEKRRSLLRMMDNDHISIKEAAKKLNLNYSAAKSIIKTFKNTGRVEKLIKK